MTGSRFRDFTSKAKIAGRLPVEFPDDTSMRASADTVHAWTYAPAQKHRQLWQYLPGGHKKRRRRSGRKVHSKRIKGRTSIHDRPAEVEDRIQFGHWESDSVLGVCGAGALHTTVERSSRFLHAAKLPGPTARATVDAQIGFTKRCPHTRSRP